MGTLQEIVLGGGCFWCLEAVYQRVRGVTGVVSGYAGGTYKNPTYDQVCQKNTGHAEVIRISFDPELISLEEILEIFWMAHDPTTMNRQGNDVGPQYRSIIMVSDDEQKAIAIASRDGAASHFPDPIVTEIVPLKQFYEAEGYHQNFYRDNQTHPYCIFVIHPKLLKFDKEGKGFLSS